MKQGTANLAEDYCFIHKALRPVSNARRQIAVVPPSNSRPENLQLKIEAINHIKPNCGIHKLDIKLASLLDDTSGIVERKRWQMVVTACYTNKVAKQLKKRKRQIQSGNIGDFVQQLKKETEPFAEHLFNKDWQNHQETVLTKKDNLKISSWWLMS